ncbi:MAG: hypothetical protein AABP62_22415 [Planctomycetota bacterium]
MTEAAPPRLTLRQRWHRLRTSPRFPYLLFFGLLVAGGLSQAYCYWWDVQIQQMLARNGGGVDRIPVYPPRIRTYLGGKFVSHFEPIRSIRMYRGLPDKVHARPDDLRWLRGLFWLRDLGFDVRSDLSEVDLHHLKRLTQLRKVDFSFASNEAITCVVKHPKLKSLSFNFSKVTDADPEVFRQIASMSQLERLSPYFNHDDGLNPVVAAGLRELARSPNVYRFQTRLVGREQFLALTSRLPDGSPPLPELRELIVCVSELVPGDCANFHHFPNLIHLDLSRSSITNADLNDLKQIPHLRTLYLEDIPQITDEGAKVLASMPNLQSLNVKRTNISKEGLLRLATLPRLRCLRAYPGGPEARAELRKQIPAGCELDDN